MENRRQVKNRLTSLAVTSLMAIIMVLSGFAMPLSQMGILSVHAATTVNSMDELRAAVNSGKSEIILGSDIAYDGQGLEINRQVTIGVSSGSHTIYLGNANTYDSMFKVVNGGNLTIHNGITLNGQKTAQGCDSNFAITNAMFDAPGYDKDGDGNPSDETYTPKGFFIDVQAGGKATLEGTITNFNTSRSIDETPRFVAPVVANGAGAEFNLGSTGKIQNNLVGYIADNSKSNQDSWYVREYVRGRGPNVPRVPERTTQWAEWVDPQSDKNRARTGDAQIDGGNAGSGITATAGAIIYKGGATGSVQGTVDNNRGDTGGIMVSDDASITVKNGTMISRNVGVTFGGGTTAEHGGEIIMVGGTMTKNIAWFGGGAVNATQNGVDWLLGKMSEGNSTPDFSKRKDGVFYMADGTLTENTAFTRGGAILVDSNGVTIQKGILSYNESRNLGGAMYVMGDNPLYEYTVHMSGLYVHDNASVTSEQGPRNDAVNRNGEVLANSQVLSDKGYISYNNVNEQLQKGLQDASPCGDTDPLGDPISQNTDDLKDSHYTSGTGGGVWMCAYGDTIFDASDSESVVITNNYATGTRYNAGNEDSKYNSIHGGGRGSEVSRSGRLGGSDLHADTGGKGTLVIQGLDTPESQWYNENTDQKYESAVSANRTNLVNKDTTPMADDDVSVQVYGNIARRGGGLASDGVFLFGKIEDQATADAKMTVAKEWALNADKKPITIRVLANDTSSEKSAVLADVPLDGTANGPADEFSSVIELAPTGQTWNGQFSFPTSISMDGTEVELYHLEYDGETIDLNSYEGRVTLGELAANGQLDQVKTVVNSNIELEYLEGNFNEDGEFVEDEDYIFAPRTMKLGDLSIASDQTYYDQVYNEETGEIEQGEKVYSVYVVGIPLTAPMSNDVNPVIVEKYVNKDVHADIVNFDQEFTYDILAYVPLSATELTITDELVKGLEFADADGNPSDVGLEVVQSIVMKKSNNHEVGENGTVTAGDVLKTKYGNTIDMIEWEKGQWAGQGYCPDITIDGNTLTVKFDKDKMHSRVFDEFLPGRWVQITFNARIKDEYRNLDALKALAAEVSDEDKVKSWEGTDTNKQSPDARDLTFANGDKVLVEALANEVKQDKAAWIGVPVIGTTTGLLFAKSEKGKYYVTSKEDQNSNGDWILLSDTEDRVFYGRTYKDLLEEADARANGRILTTRSMNLDNPETDFDEKCINKLNSHSSMEGQTVDWAVEGPSRLFAHTSGGDYYATPMNDKTGAVWVKLEPGSDDYNNAKGRHENPESTNTIREIDLVSDSVTLDPDADTGANWPVLSDEEHEGMVNQAAYNVKFCNNAEGTYKTNNVTVAPETTELDVVKTWEPGNVWPEDVESVTFTVYSKKGDTETPVYVKDGKVVPKDTEGASILTVELTKDNTSDTVEELPKLKGTTYIARETKINDKEVAYNEDKTSGTVDDLGVVSDMTGKQKDDRFVKAEQQIEGDLLVGALADNRLWVMTLEGKYYFTEVGDKTGKAEDTTWSPVPNPNLLPETATDEAKANFARAQEILGSVSSTGAVSKGTADNVTLIDLTKIYKANNTKATIEKYINKDVDAHLVEFDRAFTYDILAYVTNDADKLVITDELVSALEFSKTGSGKGVKSTNPSEVVARVAVKNKNDHTANSTVADKDTGNTTTVLGADDYTATIDDQTLVITIGGSSDADKAKIAPYRGKWVQVTFYAKYTDAAIAAAEVADSAKVNDNGTVISEIDKHDGTNNKASYTISVDNKAKYESESNTVTHDAETVEVEAEKKWENPDGSTADWPMNDNNEYDPAEVEVLVMKSVNGGDKEVVKDADDTDVKIKLTPTAPAGKSIKLPKLIDVTYSIKEDTVVPGYYSTVNGKTVTNKKGKAEVEKYVNNDVTYDFTNFDQVFEYEIMGFVPEDATEVEFTDELVESLEFVSVPTEIKVFDMGDTNNHINTVGKKGTEITEGFKPSIEEQNLSVKFEDVTDETGIRGKWLKVTFKAKIKQDAYAKVAAKIAEKKASGNSTAEDVEDEWANIDDNLTVDIDKKHDGVPNTAGIKIKVENGGTFTSDTNTVTVEPKTTELEVSKVWEVNGEEIDWPKGATIEVKVLGKNDEVVTSTTLSNKKQSAKFSKLPCLEGVTYKVVEGEVKGASEFKIGDVEKISDTEFKITNKAVTVEITKIWSDATMEEIPSAAAFKSMLILKDEEGNDVSEQHLNKLKVKAEGKRYTAIWSNLPDGEYTVEEKAVPGFGTSRDGNTITNTKKHEEKPEIEKYVNEAVHKDIVLDEVFTYDLIAYITKDADSVTITDKLNDVLTFNSKDDEIKVVDLGEEDNHLPTNDIHAVQVNDNATVAQDGDPIDAAEVTIDGQTLKVFITNKLTKANYSSVDIEYVNPSYEGYFEKTGNDYVESTDTIADPDKTYYEKSDDEYVEASVEEGDSVEGLYVLNDDEYVPASDGTAQAGTTYYELNEGTYSEVTIDYVDPSDKGYLEKNESGKYVASKDTVADPDKTYYVKSDSDEGSGYEYDGDDQPVTALRGHWIKVTFDAKVKDGKTLADVKKAFQEIKADDVEDRAEENIGNAPVVSTEDHIGVPNDTSYSIGVANDAAVDETGISEDVYKDRSNTVTVKPYDEKPEIEKFINQAVHNDIDLSDVFTYDVVAYITKDANTATITDELDKQLQFVSGAGDVRVEDLGIYNNHKVTNNIKATQVNDDATVNDPGEEIENCEVTISGRKLTVKLNDCANADQPLRGHWVRVTFQCKIADGLTLDDLKFTDINPKAIEDREAPNVGNDPVLSDEAHKGVPNKASYTIDALGDVKYSDTSNTVTVKPVTDREGDYGPEGDEDEGDVKDKDDNTGKVKGKGTRTGDETRVVLWIMSLILTMALATVLGLKKRMQRR